jgi:GMP synthase (glutamine-hydrolysing)
MPPCYSKSMINTLTAFTPEVLEEIQAEQKLRQTHELFLLFAMGSQFDHLIKLTLDRLGVYCLVADPAQVDVGAVKQLQPTGIIVSGGPSSASDHPPFDAAIYELGIPTLGICLGFQMWAAHHGATVGSAEHREFGQHPLQFTAAGKTAPLLAHIDDGALVLQSHGDRIEPGKHIQILAATDNAPVAAGRLGHLWGVQFHPEVTATVCGAQLFENFVFDICGAKDRYPAQDVAARKIAESNKPSATKKSSSPCPAAPIPRWWRHYSQKQSRRRSSAPSTSAASTAPTMKPL